MYPKSPLICLLLAFVLVCNLLLSLASVAQSPRPIFGMYLGGIGQNKPVGTAVLSDFRIAIGGNFSDVSNAASDIHFNFFNTTKYSTGRILIVNGYTQTYELILNLGNDIYDFKAKDNYIVVAGDFGIAKINPFTQQLIWKINAPIKGAIKLDIDINGNVVTLMNKNIFLFAATDGLQLGSYNVGHNYCNDISIFNSVIFVTGYDSKINSAFTHCGLLPGDSFEPVDVAFIDAFSYAPSNGATYGGDKIKYEFSTYRFEGNDLACDMSSTRGYKLRKDTQGYLYFLGETDGPKNIFRWNGKTTWKLNGGSNPASVYSMNYDNSHSIDNFPEGNTAQFVGKINMANGIVLKGVFNNTISQNNIYDYISSENGSLGIASDGTLYVGSMAGNSIYNRQSMQYFNTPLAPYSGGDPSLMGINNQLTSTTIWRTFTAANGMGSVVGIDIGYINNFGFSQAMAVVTELYAGNAITNTGYTEAFNPSATDNLNDAHLMVYDIQSQVTAFNADENFKIFNQGECIMVACELQQFNYQIIDMRGIVQQQGEYEGTSAFAINKNTLRQGVYMIKVFNHEKYFTQKIEIL